MAGAGRNAAEARRPAILGTRGGRVLVWGLGDRTAGVPAAWNASAGRPGVWRTFLLPQDAAELGGQVALHKRPGDVAVASVHMGSNYGYEVADKQRSFARSLIDTGAPSWLRQPPAASSRSRLLASG